MDGFRSIGPMSLRVRCRHLYVGWTGVLLTAIVKKPDGGTAEASATLKPLLAGDAYSMPLPAGDLVSVSVRRGDLSYAAQVWVTVEICRLSSGVEVPLLPIIQCWMSGLDTASWGYNSGVSIPRDKRLWRAVPCVDPLLGDLYLGEESFEGDWQVVVVKCVVTTDATVFNRYIALEYRDADGNMYSFSVTPIITASMERQIAWSRHFPSWYSIGTSIQGPLPYIQFTNLNPIRIVALDWQENDRMNEVEVSVVPLPGIG